MTYTQPKDFTGCKIFVENPVGALITTSQLFSGMEAVNVMWVRAQTKFSFHRSNRLRAIHRLCIIDTDSDTGRAMDVGGMEVDDTFANCHRAWLGDLHWCKSCDNSKPTLLCRHCAKVCHQSCEREDAVFRSILHWIFQFNPCSCKTSGCCKLNRPTRMFVSCGPLEAIGTTVVIFPVAIVLIVLHCIAIAFVKLRSILQNITLDSS